MKERSQLIKDEFSDLLSRFFYYERKEDEDLPPFAIEDQLRTDPDLLDDLVIMLNSSLHEARARSI